MPGEVGHTVPTSQTVPEYNVFTPSPNPPVPPATIVPPMHTCPTCGKTFEFPFYMQFGEGIVNASTGHYDAKLGYNTVLRPVCPHCRGLLQ